MLDSIKSFFHSSMSPDSPNPAVRNRDTRLAACALLLELAHSDDDFTEPERAHLRSAVRRQFGLDAAQSEELLILAEKERAEKARKAEDRPSPFEENRVNRGGRCRNNMNDGPSSKVKHTACLPLPIIGPADRIPRRASYRAINES